jgi:ABC-type transport system involved in cytochrome c biogenesis permease component
MNWNDAVAAGFRLLANAAGDWSDFVQRRFFGEVMWALGQTTLMSLFVLVGAVLVAGAKTRRSWQEEPPSERQVWFRRTFCTPVLWLVFFRRWMRRKLERNPIGWLEQRTWSGRLVTWGWLAVLISIDTLAVTEPRSAKGFQEIMAWLLAGSIAMSAAGSFRRERETGMLELLLVSPLSESQIISGRLRGLWGQFFPTAGLLLVIWVYLSTFVPDSSGARVILFFAVTFLSVPVVGLYFSLRCRNFITAFLATVGVGLLLPLILPDLAKVVWQAYVRTSAHFSWERFDVSWEMRPCVSAAVCQILLAAFYWNRLHRRLRKRGFPLQRSEIN